MTPNNKINILLLKTKTYHSPVIVTEYKGNVDTWHLKIAEKVIIRGLIDELLNECPYMIILN